MCNVLPYHASLLKGLIQKRKRSPVLHRAPRIVQTQLGEGMKSIVLVDFPEKWPSLLPQLAQNLQSQVSSKISTPNCLETSIS